MSNFVIMIDTNSEVPFEFAKKNDLKVFQMPYILDGVESLYDLGENTDYAAFFEKLSNGAKASTSTRSAYDIELFFKEQLEAGKDILYIGFSSQLSAHLSICQGEQQKLKKEFPDRKFVIVDSLKISAPLGALIIQAVAMKKDGKSLEEIATWLEENKHRARGWFVVDDLMHLKRGGRVSGAAAVVGSLLAVKPILYVGDDGKIVSEEKVKGKKNVIKHLKTKFDESVLDAKNTDVCILHATNLSGAESLKKKIEADHQVRRIWIQDIGPVIGSHTGPGVLALCFLGK
jgi:DegV family protein with EDD domain